MIITLSDLLAGIRERKAALGIIDTPERTDAMRNSGSRRTARYVGPDRGALTRRGRRLG